jgi:endogenous inhibitor of DNA gyrase (YacG/DUF329 family)
MKLTVDPNAEIHFPFYCKKCNDVVVAEKSTGNEDSEGIFVIRNKCPRCKKWTVDR